jgi:flavin reductase (DIM6/NTAB) family NADH-FMN oxidoreductase RutF
MHVPADTLDRAAAYRLLISAIVPRPVAWVGSVDADGVDNLAPFSFFMGVSATPPMIAFAAARLRDGTLKHTARNIVATREFTVSIPEEDTLDDMHRTSAPFPGSEFDAVGVARAASRRVRPPRVAAARVALECRLDQAVDVGNSLLIVGEVLEFFVADALWAEGEVRLDGFQPVARLGGDAYTTLGTILHRPPARV